MTDRIIQAVLIILLAGILVLAVSAVADGRTIQPPVIDSTIEDIAHNTPPVVEQEYQHFPDPFDCSPGILIGCVTNTGRCVWDVDDHLSFGRGSAGALQSCLFADALHTWSVRSYDLARRPKPYTVTLTFGNAYGSRTFRQEVTDGAATMCVQGPNYSAEESFPIPYQGGPGTNTGFAVPTEVTAAIAGDSRRLSLRVETFLVSRLHPDDPTYIGCPVGVPLTQDEDIQATWRYGVGR